MAYKYWKRRERLDLLQAQQDTRKAVEDSAKVISQKLQEDREFQIFWDTLTFDEKREWKEQQTSWMSRIGEVSPEKHFLPNLDGELGYFNGNRSLSAFWYATSLGVILMGLLYWVTVDRKSVV